MKLTSFIKRNECMVCCNKATKDLKDIFSGKEKLTYLIHFNFLQIRNKNSRLYNKVDKIKTSIYNPLCDTCFDYIKEHDGKQIKIVRGESEPSNCLKED